MEESNRPVSSRKKKKSSHSSSAAFATCTSDSLRNALRRINNEKATNPDQSVERLTSPGRRAPRFGPSRASIQVSSCRVEFNAEPRTRPWAVVPRRLIPYRISSAACTDLDRETQRGGGRPLLVTNPRYLSFIGVSCLLDFREPVHPLVDLIGNSERQVFALESRVCFVFSSIASSFLVRTHMDIFIP